jgi:hypothetical protein
VTALPLPALTATGVGLGAASVVVEATASVNVGAQVLVNWNGDGSTFVDESSHCTAIALDRGRAQVNDQVTAGTCQVTLENYAGRFSPLNSLSPLYPTVTVGRLVQVQTVYRGVYRSAFVGRITEIAQDTRWSTAQVTLTLLDAFEQFRLQQASTDFGAGARVDPTVDTVIAGILTAAGWTGGTRLEPGRSLAMYAAPSPNVLTALQHAALQEVGGLLFVGRDGAIVFQNAAHRANAAPRAVLPAVEAMTAGMRSTDVLEEIVVTYNTYAWPQGDAVSSIYSGHAGQVLGPQASTTITDFFTAPAVRSVAQPLSGTDYAANTAPDGTGMDVSTLLWLEDFTVAGSSFTATLYNSLPYAVYLSRFQLRGQALAARSVGSTLDRSTTGAPVPNQRLSATFDYVTDPAVITAWTEQRLAALSRQEPRPQITLVARTPSLTHLLLDLDLSDVLVLRDDATAQLSGFNDRFFVEHIHLGLQFEPPQIATTTLALFSYDLGVVA